MHSTQQYSDIYNFTFIAQDSIQENAKIIKIDCSNTSYFVDKPQFMMVMLGRVCIASG
jgi:hypothetical protein